MSKPLDLNTWFEYDNNTTKNNVDEFINFWNKLSWNDIKPWIVQSWNIWDTYKKENFKIIFHKILFFIKIFTNTYKNL